MVERCVEQVEAIEVVLAPECDDAMRQSRETPQRLPQADEVFGNLDSRRSEDRMRSFRLRAAEAAQDRFALVDVAGGMASDRSSGRSSMTTWMILWA